MFTTFLITVTDFTLSTFRDTALGIGCTTRPFSGVTKDAAGIASDSRSARTPTSTAVLLLSVVFSSETSTLTEHAAVARIGAKRRMSGWLCMV
jgi:hypothetical protein